MVVPPAHAHMTVLGRPKEILGVECAQGRSGHAVGCVGTAATLRPQLSGPSLAARSLNFSVFLSISQYFSVFLSAAAPLYLSYISVISKVYLSGSSAISQLYLSYLYII